DLPVCGLGLRYPPARRISLRAPASPCSHQLAVQRLDYKQSHPSSSKLLRTIVKQFPFSGKLLRKSDKRSREAAREPARNSTFGGAWKRHPQGGRYRPGASSDSIKVQ